MFSLDSKKIYIAGINGMVGSALKRRLQNESNVSIFGHSSKQLNLREYKQSFEVLNEIKPEILIIAAAKVGGILANSNFPVEFLLENLQIQNNLISIADELDIDRVLFLGSSCIYPKYSEQPISEESLLTGELEKTNEAYALAKIAGLKLINAYRQEYGKHWISAMPTNLYGPGDNYDLNTSHVVPALIAKFYAAKITDQSEVEVWGSGSPMREFMHVDDLADACTHLLKNYDDSIAINVGTGKEVSIKELAELVAEIIDYQGNIIWDQTKPDGTPRKLLDVTRLKNSGWQSKISLREGLTQTISEYSKVIS